MANFVHSVPEVGSSSGPARMTRSRARQEREERERATNTLARRTARARRSQGETVTTRETDTLARRTARARRSQGETVTTRETNTLARRTARVRRSQEETVTTRETNTLARRTARARQTQQQASTPEWSRLPVLNRTNPAAIYLGHGHQCSHCNARLLSIMASHTHSHHCTFWAQLFRINAFVIVLHTNTRDSSISTQLYNCIIVML